MSNRINVKPRDCAIIYSDKSKGIPVSPLITQWLKTTLEYFNGNTIKSHINTGTIKQFEIYAYEAETFSLDIDVRRTELINQNWSRKKSEKLASSEGISFNDEHWAVIRYLRKNYLNNGVKRYARALSRELCKEFSIQGGKKYLHNLFPGGPVTQGCRLASLRTPANAVDASFGTAY